MMRAMNSTVRAIGFLVGLGACIAGVAGLWGPWAGMLLFGAWMLPTFSGYGAKTQ